MKCAEFEQICDPFLDGELDDLQSQKTRAHLVDCQNCRLAFESRKRTQEFLRVQAQILPATDFDNKMLKAFANHRKEKTLNQQKPFANLWAINSLRRYGLTATIFLVGIGFAFLLGRLSVSSSPILTTSLPAETFSHSKAEEFSPEKSPALENISKDNKVKVVTKYVKVPVVKEKIVEKKVYITQKFKEIEDRKTNEILAQNKIEESKIAEQFNLRDLQPVSKISYKIVRKGELNEE